MNEPWAYTFSSIGKKAVLAASGALLGLFLLVHLLGNATLFMGRVAFVAYANHLHSLGALLPVLEGLLLVVLVLHVGLGLALYAGTLKVRPTRYAVRAEPRARTLASRTMPYSGLMILVFLAVHPATLRIGGQAGTTVDLLRQALRVPGMLLFYLVSLLALILHGSHGFWSLFHSLGFNHPRYDPLLRRGAVLVSVVAGAVLMLIPLLAFFVDDFLL